MRKFIVFVCCILMLFVLLSAGYRLIFTPVKYAIELDDLDNLGKPYYLVQWVQVTGSEWMIVGDQNGMYIEPKCIVATGNVPDVVKNYDVATGHNTFVCYGECLGTAELSADVKMERYQFESWDILYPVKRNTPIPFMPKGYLCNIDFR